MSVQRNIETVRRFYTAGPATDDSERRTFASPDIVWHVPGDNPVSGRYEGEVAVFKEMIGRMGPLTSWDIDVVNVMGNADHVVATVHLTGERRGHRIDCPGAHVFRLDDDARIVEAWGFSRDQAALDDFFRA